MIFGRVLYIEMKKDQNIKIQILICTYRTIVFRFTFRRHENTIHDVHLINHSIPHLDYVFVKHYSFKRYSLIVCL